MNSPNPRAPTATGAGRREDLLLVIFTGVVVCLAFGRAIVNRWRSLFDSFQYTGDALQHLAPFWKFHHPECAPPGYLGDYYLNVIHPPLFKLAYFLLGIVASPPEAARVFTVILMLGFLGVLAAAAHRLQGAAAACLTVLFGLASVLSYDLFSGGLERAFGMLCAALLALCLVSGAEFLFGPLLVFSVLLYPAAAALGLVAFSLLLMLPAQYRTKTANWTLGKRLVFIAATGFMVGAAALPQISGGWEYGRRITVLDAAEFPEAGPEGRYSAGDMGVSNPTWLPTYQLFMRALNNRVSVGRGAPWSSFEALVLLLVIVPVALAYLLKRKDKERLSPQATRLLLLLAAGLGTHQAAVIFFPLLYIPSRYLNLSIPVVSLLAVPGLWAYLGARLFSRWQWFPKKISVFLIGLLFFALLHDGVREKTLPSARSLAPLFSFAAKLPSEQMIAGWPNGPVKFLPYFSCRSVLLFDEAHQAFHERFTLELRARMKALIAGYFASDVEPLINLRDRHGVRYLLVDLKDFEKPRRYFAPFDAMTRASFEEGKKRGFLLQSLAETAEFRLGSLRLINLMKLEIPQRPRAGA